MLIWALAALPLGVYNVAQNNNVPLMVQPQLFGLLACTCWVQCFYYDQHFSKSRTVSIFLGFLVLFGGMEAGFVFAVRHGLEENNDRPLQFFGVMTAILLFAGLLPQYYEIWKMKEVQGVSMLFMLVDGLGGLFSFLSLVFQPPLDPLLSFSYVSVVLLDTGIMLLKITLNPIARRRRAREQGVEAAAAHGQLLPTNVPETAREKPLIDPPHEPYSLPEASERRQSEGDIPLQSVGESRETVVSAGAHQRGALPVEAVNQKLPA